VKFSADVPRYESLMLSLRTELEGPGHLAAQKTFGGTASGVDREKWYEAHK
jgi:hypothetical protein